MAKYDPSGAFLWAKRAGGTYYAQGRGIATDGAGNSLVTGYFWGTATFGPGEPNQTSLTSAGSGDIFVAKYDPSGLLLWAKRAGGTSYYGEQGYGIATDGTGNSLVTGYFWGTATFGPGEPNQTSLTSAGGGGADIFVAKYDPSGALLWAERAGGTSSYDEGYGIATDGANNSLVTGRFGGTATFGPGEPNETSLTSAGSSDIFVAKYDPSGALLWAKRAGGTIYDGGYGIATDGAGNSLVTGQFGGTATFGPGEPNETSMTSAGSGDIFVAKYDPSGALLWAKRAGGIGHQRGNGIATDGAGNSLVTGGFWGTATFDPGESNETSLTSAGGLDIFVAKYGVVTDSDGDGIPYDTDNCPAVFNPGQADKDGDGVGNKCDNAPSVPNTDQADEDGDGFGDAIDIDKIGLQYGAQLRGPQGLLRGADDGGLDFPYFDFGWHCIGDTACGELTITNGSVLDVIVAQVCAQCTVVAGSECGLFYIEQPAPRDLLLHPGESVTIGFCYDPFEEPPAQGFRWDRCFDAAIAYQIPGDPRYQTLGVYLEGKRAEDGCFLGRMATEHDFGQAFVGFYQEQIVTVWNTGCEPLTVEQVLSDRSEFTLVSPSAPFTVAEYTIEDVVVRFAPSEVGEVSGVLTLVSDAQNRDVQTEELIGEVEIAVRGVGIEAILGDVNGDTEVNVLDVLAVVNIVLGAVVPTEAQAWAADMDGNGAVNIVDAVMLVNEGILGLGRCADVTPEVVKYFSSLESELTAPEYARLMELVKGVGAAVPSGYTLAQNYPNPFNPETEIAFGLPEAAVVRLKVYNVLGQEVAELVNGTMEAGHHRVTWNASDLPSGVYFYCIKSNEFTATRRMVLMR